MQCDLGHSGLRVYVCVCVCGVGSKGVGGCVCVGIWDRQGRSCGVGCSSVSLCVICEGAIRVNTAYVGRFG